MHGHDAKTFSDGVDQMTRIIVSQIRREFGDR